MATKKTKKSFDITAKMEVTVMATIFADSFEEALEISKTLQVSDFIEYVGEFIDIEEFGIQSISTYPNSIPIKINYHTQ
jgi:hypothetical protein